MLLSTGSGTEGSDTPTFVPYGTGEEMQKMFVEQMISLARARLVTIGEDALLIEVASLLTTETDIVLVCDSDGALVGVVTKTDVVRQISRCQGSSCTCPVATVMTRDLLLCRAPDRLADVSQRMKERHLKNIP